MQDDEFFQKKNWKIFQWCARFIESEHSAVAEQPLGANKKLSVYLLMCIFFRDGPSIRNCVSYLLINDNGSEKL